MCLRIVGQFGARISKPAAREIGITVNEWSSFADVGVGSAANGNAQ
jgi:hypothetical protein